MNRRWWHRHDGADRVRRVKRTEAAVSSVSQALPLESASGEIGRTARPQGQLAIVWRQLRRNRAAMIGAFLIICELTIALAAPLVAPYDPLDQNPRAALQAPSRDHLFGTDDTGRDLLSRVIYGARISLRVVRDRK